MGRHPLRTIFGALLVLCAGAVHAADSAAERLAQALRLGEVVQVLSAEGVEHAAALDAEMLGDSGGAYFTDQAAALFDPDRMQADLTQVLAQEMSPEDLNASAAYFESPTGRRIIALELSARAAFSDPDVEAVAVDHYHALPPGDPVRGLVRDYVEANDLVARNVDGMQASDYSFYRGLVAGGAYDPDHEAYLALLLNERDALYLETDEWAMSFHLLAYDPLTEAEHRENLAYSLSPAGKAFNTAMFAAFDQVYEDIFFQLGLLVAGSMQATDL